MAYSKLVAFLFVAALFAIQAQPAESIDTSRLSGSLRRLLTEVEDDEPAAKTVADLAAHAPGNISILINGVNRADLQTILANPGWKATIFAPTNRAFEAALLKLKLTPVQLYADKTALTNILSYHVIHDQAITVADFEDGQELTTVQQGKLTVHVDKVAGTTIQGASETAKIIAADIKAGEAVIHVVDSVLLPPPPPSK
eukprot:jgi/Chrzof1/1279/Cz10g01010.t1